MCIVCLHGDLKLLYTHKQSNKTVTPSYNRDLYYDTGISSLVPPCPLNSILHNTTQHKGKVHSDAQHMYYESSLVEGLISSTDEVLFILITVDNTLWIMTVEFITCVSLKQ